MERVREGERVGKTRPPCSSSLRYPSSTRTCYPMQKLPFHGCSRSKCTSSLIGEPMPPHEAGIVAPLSPPSPLPFLHIHPQPITSHSHRPHLWGTDKYRMGVFPVSTAPPMHTPYLSYRTTTPPSSQHPSIFPALAQTHDGKKNHKKKSTSPHPPRPSQQLSSLSSLRHAPPPLPAAPLTPPRDPSPSARYYSSSHSAARPDSHSYCARTERAPSPRHRSPAP